MKILHLHPAPTVSQGGRDCCARRVGTTCAFTSESPKVFNSTGKRSGLKNGKMDSDFSSVLYCLEPLLQEDEAGEVHCCTLSVKTSAYLVSESGNYVYV